MKHSGISAAAALLGRLGGLSTSPAKVAASRRNGCKGGRPRSPKAKGAEGAPSMGAGGAKRPKRATLKD